MNIKSSLITLFSFFATSNAFAIDPVYDGPNGIREQVFATNCLFCHSSNLTGAARNGAPPSVNWDTYEAARPKADRAIVRAVVEMSMPPLGSGRPLLNEEQRAAMLAWQKAGFPKDATITSTTATFDGTTLTLPVVNVNNQKFRATLRLINLANSPTGVGFMLETATLTTASSKNAATYSTATGVVTMPFVDMKQSGANQGPVRAEMAFIPGSNPMQFSLTSYAPVAIRPGFAPIAEK